MRKACKKEYKRIVALQERIQQCQDLEMKKELEKDLKVLQDDFVLVIDFDFQMVSYGLRSLLKR